VLDGRYLFPAVMGLEAMAQVASAVTGAAAFAFESVTFERGIVVPADGSLRIRIAALVREAGDVDVVIRSVETAFEADHFRARCRPVDASRPIADEKSDIEAPPEASAQACVAADQIYESVLFQRGRFRRVAQYTTLRATSCTASIVPGSETAWFGPFHPRETLLGDAGARDAAIHAVQACYPAAAVVPIAVERIVGGRMPGDRPLVVHAVERGHERVGDHEILIYDIDVRDDADVLVERWQGARLRSVGAARVPVIAPLMGPYFERRVAELFPWTAGALSAAVLPRGFVHHARSEVRRARELGGVGAAVRERFAAGSVSYSAEFAFTVSGAAVVACDVSDVTTKTEVLWRDMHTPERFELAMLLARDGREDRGQAATRVWCAAECLTKAGLPAGAPLVLRSAEPDGWTTFRAGTADVATYAVALRDEPAPSVFAMLLRSA
jgi:enediyne polyketide synthase